MAKELERAGIPTVHVTNLVSVSENTGRQAGSCRDGPFRTFLATRRLTRTRSGGSGGGWWNRRLRC